jgi:uncharacterized protein YPO0396
MKRRKNITERVKLCNERLGRIVFLNSLYICTITSKRLINLDLP